MAEDEQESMDLSEFSSSHDSEDVVFQDCKITSGRMGVAVVTILMVIF